MRFYYYITILFAFIVSTNSFSQEIKWISLEDAVYLQEAAPRNIIIDMYTNWCGPCKLLDRNTFANKDVAKYINDNFYAVKFNAEGNDVVNFKGYTFENPNYDPAKANRRNKQRNFEKSFVAKIVPKALAYSWRKHGESRHFRTLQSVAVRNDVSTRWFVVV